MGKVDEEKWLYYYNELKRYYSENNNSNVPVSYVTEDGVKLGKWLTKQRFLYSKNKLSENRIKKLERLSISWNYLEDRWNINYEYLRKYYEEHGNSNVPQHYVTSDGVNLGIWLDEQRMAYKNGLMNKRKIKFLKELNFKAQTKMSKWDELYNELEIYYYNNGDVDVPTRYITDTNIKLGNWLNFQKQTYKNYKLSREHAMLLNDLDIDWSRHDTIVLNKEITDGNVYKRIMLERMNHILDDLSYGAFGNITDEKAQVRIEKEIIKRMWR